MARSSPPPWLPPLAGLPEEELAWPRDMTGSGGLLLPVAPLRQMLWLRWRQWPPISGARVPWCAQTGARGRPNCEQVLVDATDGVAELEFLPPAPGAAFGDKHNIRSWGDRHQNHGAAR